MDAHVDLKVLEHEKDFLQKEIRHLENIKDRISRKQEIASEDLEGDQFEMASGEIENIVSSIDDSIAHLEALITDIEGMIDKITSYTQCLYEG